jgi:hypothetical protein
VTISYPLSLPSTLYPDRIDWITETLVGASDSPFSFVPQTYVWNAERWRARLTWNAMMSQVSADDIETLPLALNGREGSFLLGDLIRTTPRGTWAGQSPLVKGAGQTGKTLLIDGLTPTTTTVIKGDWFQLGSGATSRLHRLTASGTVNGSGEITLDFWPSLRVSPADNAALTLSSAKGLFMLAQNSSGWTQEDGRDSGISLECIEDLRGL